MKINFCYYLMEKLNGSVFSIDKAHNKNYLKKTKIWEKTFLTKKKRGGQNDDVTRAIHL